MLAKVFSCKSRCSLICWLVRNGRGRAMGREIGKMGSQRDGQRERWKGKEIGIERFKEPNPKIMMLKRTFFGGFKPCFAHSPSITHTDRYQPHRTARSTVHLPVYLAVRWYIELLVQSTSRWSRKPWEQTVSNHQETAKKERRYHRTQDRTAIRSCWPTVDRFKRGLKKRSAPLTMQLNGTPNQQTGSLTI